MKKIFTLVICSMVSLLSFAQDPVGLDEVFIKGQNGKYLGLENGHMALVNNSFAWTFYEMGTAYWLCDYDETYWATTSTDGFLSTVSLGQTSKARNFYFYEATFSATTVEGQLVEAPMQGSDFIIVVKHDGPKNKGLYALYCSPAKDNSDYLDVVKVSDDETQIPEEITISTEDESSYGAIDLEMVVWNLVNLDLTSIATATTTATDAIYNITGQRITKLQKGINIVNNKKVIK